MTQVLLGIPCLLLPSQCPGAPGRGLSFSWHQSWSLPGFCLEIPTQFLGSALVKRVGKYNPEENVKKKAKLLGPAEHPKPGRDVSALPIPEPGKGG